MNEAEAAPAPRVALQPITDADVTDVAEFLHEHMNNRVAASAWASAMRAPWQHDPPNHGFHLRAAGNVVGAYLALYSRRDVDGRTVRVCNMAAWCVLEEFRFKSVRLAKALLDQEGVEFTDFSPSGNVIALNERLGFERLDTSTSLGLNLPWPTRRTSGSVVSDLAEIERLLSGQALEVFMDHRRSPAVRHLALRRGDRVAHVMFRRDRRKRLPLFATVLYASDPALLTEMRHHLERHLLRRGLPALLCETRVTGCRPTISVKLKSPRPKMYRSDRLRPEDIDYLYSELTELAW